MLSCRSFFSILALKAFLKMDMKIFIEEVVGWMRVVKRVVDSDAMRWEYDEKK